jgi:hypothetical protein
VLAPLILAAVFIGAIAPDIGTVKP